MRRTCCTSAVLIAAHAEVPARSDTPYPGTIAIHVDTTDLAQRIMRVREVVPVQAGPLTCCRNGSLAITRRAERSKSSPES